jgi:hypothetical protein
VNEDNLNDVWREASRHFWKKETEYMKEKIKELESNSKNVNIREQFRAKNGFKKGYQLRTNLIKEERGDLLTDPLKSLSGWKNYFCQLLNVQRTGGVRQTEKHTAESYVTAPVLRG